MLVQKSVTCDIAPEDCINLIEKIPRSFASLECAEAKDFDKTWAKDVEQEYRGKVLWLEFYLLGNTESLSDLTIVQRFYCSSLVERIISFWRLAQEVFFVTNWMEVRGSLSPQEWLVLCEAEIFKDRFGFKEYPSITVQAVQSNPPTEIIFNISNGVSSIKTLEGIAASIAKHDGVFREKYKYYLKQQKQYSQQIKKLPSKISEVRTPL